MYFFGQLFNFYMGCIGNNYSKSPINKSYREGVKKCKETNSFIRKIIGTYPIILGFFYIYIKNVI